MVFRLSRDIAFPHPCLSDDDGLLAVGGDLSMERLKLAYAFGIFPWFSEDEPILWYAPPERCVLFPGKVNISASMRQVLRKGHFSVTMNEAFPRVIQACAGTPRKGQDGTWITREMQKAYTGLHKRGIAHSVEVWQDGRLAGGLYGVAQRKVFCGESMFSHVPNASKAALIWLCRSGLFDLIDCQVSNPHLISMGAEIIPRDSFMAMLRK